MSRGSVRGVHAFLSATGYAVNASGPPGSLRGGPYVSPVCARPRESTRRDAPLPGCRARTYVRVGSTRPRTVTHVSGTVHPCGMNDLDRQSAHRIIGARRPAPRKGSLPPTAPDAAPPCPSHTRAARGCTPPPGHGAHPGPDHPRPGNPPTGVPTPTGVIRTQHHVPRNGPRRGLAADTTSRSRFRPRGPVTGDEVPPLPEHPSAPPQHRRRHASLAPTPLLHPVFELSLPAPTPARRTAEHRPVAVVSPRRDPRYAARARPQPCRPASGRAAKTVGPISGVRATSRRREGSRVREVTVRTGVRYSVKTTPEPAFHTSETFAYRHAVPAFGAVKAAALVGSSPRRPAKHGPPDARQRKRPGPTSTSVTRSTGSAPPRAARRRAARGGGVARRRTGQPSATRNPRRTKTASGFRRSTPGEPPPLHSGDLPHPASKALRP